MSNIVKEDVVKATNRDKKEYLSEATKKTHSQSSGWVYLLDFDDDYVYFDKEQYVEERYLIESYRASYSGSVVRYTVNDDAVKVARETVYTVVEDSQTDTENVVMKCLKKFFGKSKEVLKQEVSKQDVFKQFNEEEMISYEPLYAPADWVDGDGQGMTQETINKMVTDIKEKIDGEGIQANLFHKVATNAFSYVDCFKNPWPTTEINGQTVEHGQPVIVAKYHNEKAWELRKSGKIMGPSIGARGTVRKVDNE